MSVSADNEVKTVVLDAEGDFADLVQIDATEDREILSYNVVSDGTNGQSSNDAFSLFLGSSAGSPDVNSATDNEKWQVSGSRVVDDTNGNALASGYGFNDLTTGPGVIEWDEDETLSLDYGSTNATTDLVVEVHYVER